MSLRSIIIPTVLSVVNIQQCPKDWMSRPGSSDCYSIDRTAKSWLDARDACIAIGGTLTSVNSQEEQTWLEARMADVKARIWIGMSVRQQEGTWVWTDNSPVTYTNWNPGEPNAATAGEDCAALATTFKWTNLLCRNKYAFVCKKNTDTEPTSSSNHNGIAVKSRNHGSKKPKTDCKKSPRNKVFHTRMG